MGLRLSNKHLTIAFKDLGGELTSIKDADGLEYLWQGDATYWGGQAPLLFPICGSLREDEAYYPENGKGLEKGSMPRHGLVRKCHFKGEQVSQNEVVYTLESTDEMYASFPYRFQISSRYTLRDKTIRISYEVTNKEGTVRMPFTLGGHPGFNCPLLTNEAYEDYYLQFEKPETLTVPRVFPETGLVDLDDRSPFLENADKLELTYDLFKEDTLVLDRLESQTIRLRSKNHDKGLKLHLGDFPFLVVWSTANKGPFVALEPWLGMSTSKNETDYFDEKINTQWLEPGESKAYAFSIEIL